ncbi:Proteasome subunit alpha type-4 [Diplonema papillatum]|nr:Proteasome subunit alpha type-4 [Diplonema papillatum]
MSGRRFDQRTTIFSQEGRLYQVEYAMAATQQAPLTLGMVTKEGVVLVAERPQHSPLLESEKGQIANISGEKIYLIDDHIAVSVAGLTADANTLMNHARLTSQRYTYQFKEPCPVEHLIHVICDIKQGYTQIGGLRPFGVSFLYAGWDSTHGMQLYHSDPSGNYSAWKANAIGQHTENAQSILKQEWKPDMTLHEGMVLGTKILSKCGDANITTEKVELAYLTKKDGESPKFHICSNTETDVVVAECKRLKEEEERQKEKERKENMSIKD